MVEKHWKEMNGWEKVWEVTQIVVGGAVWLVFLPLALFSKGGQNSVGRCRQGSLGGQSGSVWPVGSGGKKPGSWSSGRHRQR